MDMENRQANRILNSRYPQDGPVKPWPWSAQVQILGAEDSGRHSLLNRLCQDTFTTSLNATNSGRRRIETRGQSCDIYFDIPVSLDEQKHIAQLDALVLVFDLSDPRSFQVLCAFCARCELAGVELGPCLIVGTKADLVEPRSQAVDDAWRLARRLGGSFVACSARDGSGIEALAEEVVQSVVEARKRLVRESEETLGEAVRRLMAQTPGRRPSLRRRLSARVGWRAEAEVEVRRPAARAKCTGAPPRWTMRRLINPLPWVISRFAGFKPGESEVTLVEPCPLEFQLSVDLVSPAATDWAPKF